MASVIDFNTGGITPEEPSKIPMRVYEIVLGDDDEPVYMEGYLGITPLFAAIMDANEKVKFICPPGNYKYIRRLEPDEEAEFKGVQASLFPDA